LAPVSTEGAGPLSLSHRDRNLGLMRLLVPAASAALLISVALSAKAAPGPADVGAATETTEKAPATATGMASGMETGTSAGGPAGGITRVAPQARFVWPLAPRPTVSRRFEQPRSQWSSGHRGVDLSGVVGQSVLSAGEGVVAFSGVVAGRGVITVRHSGGLRTTYEPVDDRLAAGTVVHRGTPIGVISATPGHCEPLTCLHWGAVTEQVYRDPLSLLGFGRPILLPLG
jgi:murein DD-endopeptidase MepM/ murein hydrolase activator NlpD